MKLSIYTIDKTLFSGSVTAVTLPTTQGQITVLDDHLPLITLLAAGNISVQKADKNWENIDFPGGILEVRPESELVVLANPG